MLGKVLQHSRNVARADVKAMFAIMRRRTSTLVCCIVTGLDKSLELAKRSWDMMVEQPTISVRRYCNCQGWEISEDSPRLT